jgi:hypothetical protein
MLRRSHIFFLGGVALAWAASASAHNDELAPEVPGTISWQSFEQADAIEWNEADGTTHIKPGFTPELTALDGTEVKIVGFPLKVDATKSAPAHILLFAAKPDCFFHIGVGPLGFIETDIAPTPGQSDEAMVLRGRLELVHADRGGVFYRLHGAQPVPMPAS